jgi:lysozyme
MTYAASEACVKKLCNLEGFRELPYRDGGGLWTIGFGRLCGSDAKKTTREAEMGWLRARVAEICKDLEDVFKGMPLLQHQVDALCLFIYNIGMGAFRQSDTCKYLLMHNWRTCFAHWSQWCHDQKGEVEAGLVARREYEIKLFIYASY